MSKKAEEKQKFTDEQTLKALELCQAGTFENCQKCPYRIGCADGEFSLERDALDLINRQKAEIERLERLESRNSFLEIEYKNQGNLFWERVNGAKADAVKAFADRVKQTICDNSYPDSINGKPVTVFKTREGYKAIDDLVDKMAKEATT